VNEFNGIKDKIEKGDYVKIPATQTKSGGMTASGRGVVTPAWTITVPSSSRYPGRVSVTWWGPEKTAVIRIRARHEKNQTLFSDLNRNLVEID
jgi:hypothetical protein